MPKATFHEGAEYGWIDVAPVESARSQEMLQFGGLEMNRCGLCEEFTIDVRDGGWPGTVTCCVVLCVEASEEVCEFNEGAARAVLEQRLNERLYGALL